MAVLEQMEGWSLSLSCVKTSSANWLALNGETGRTTHVFHFGFESQKAGSLQKPFGFNKCTEISSLIKLMFLSSLCMYFKLIISPLSILRFSFECEWQ